eukprot:GHVH01016234.1.p1 GENE.GHVH01016234.1~~GHVH01016234.1.p1  ORF type:complete len:149 (+),score=6.02 GHVH01016234.1:357-803(+)
MIEQRVLKQIANQIRQKEGNDILYKMAISDLQNCGFLTPKIQKIVYIFFKVYKIQNFKNFQKTGRYVREPPLMSDYAKFQTNISIFDPQMTLISVQFDGRIFFKSQILTFLHIIHKNKMHHWIAVTKLDRKHVYFIPNFGFQNLTFFA